MELARLSGNKALPWSLELIERYEDRWHWERYKAPGTAYREQGPALVR